MTPYQEALRQERHAYNAWLAAADAWVSDDPTTTEYKAQRRTARELNAAHIRAQDKLIKSRDLLPPPKPNAQVLATALQHTAKRDGLGWGFEHTALEQDTAYSKWLKKARKQPSDLE